MTVTILNEHKKYIRDIPKSWNYEKGHPLGYSYNHEQDRIFINLAGREWVFDEPFEMEKRLGEYYLVSNGCVWLFHLVADDGVVQ